MYSTRRPDSNHRSASSDVDLETARVTFESDAEEATVHSFSELVDWSVSFSLAKLTEEQRSVSEALQTSAATSLVKSLQMIQLQKAILAVGIFSIFESLLQDRLQVKNGFEEAVKILENHGKLVLKEKLSNYQKAINVLKHGKGSSYNTLLTNVEMVPFRIRKPRDHFFFEGDVSEISTLIEVDDAFVLGCANIIREVCTVINDVRPRCFL